MNNRISCHTGRKGSKGVYIFDLILETVISKKEFVLVSG